MLHPDREVKLFSKWQKFYDELFKLTEINIKDSSSADDILENAKAENEGEKGNSKLIILILIVIVIFRSQIHTPIDESPIFDSSQRKSNTEQNALEIFYSGGRPRFYSSCEGNDFF